MKEKMFFSKMGMFVLVMSIVMMACNNSNGGGGSQQSGKELFEKKMKVAEAACMAVVPLFEKAIESSSTQDDINATKVAVEKVKVPAKELCDALKNFWSEKGDANSPIVKKFTDATNIFIPELDAVIKLLNEANPTINKAKVSEAFDKYRVAMQAWWQAL